MKIYLLLIFTLTILYTQSQIPIPHSFEIVSIYKQLSTKSLEELKSIALKLEEYSHKKKGGKILGGLHDYIFNLRKDDLIKYCLEEVHKNEELMDLEKFNMVTSGKNTFEKDIKLGGLHDYIFKMDRNTLIKLALTAEAYDNKKSGMVSMEPLKGRLSSMSNEDLVRYVSEMTRKYPELDSEEEMNSLSESLGIRKSLEESLLNLGRDLKDVGRQRLIKYAIKIEKYSRKGQGEIYGGLHDLLRFLSDDQLREYIVQMAKTYHELNSLESLDRLLEEGEKGFFTGFLKLMLNQF